MKKENKIKLVSDEKIEILLEEYKELLKIKGKYEELKQHPEIKYIYVCEPYPTKIIDTTPTVTWKVGK